MKPLHTDNLDRFSGQVVEIMPLLLREFAKREDNPLTRGGITFPQMVALHYLDRRPRVNMTELAQALGVKTSSVSVLVSRLDRQKLASRRHDREDRRVVWVSATPKGRRMMHTILDQKRRSIRDVFSCLSAAERGQYLSALMKVRAHLLKGAAAAVLALFLCAPAGFAKPQAPPAPLKDLTLSEAYRLALVRSEDLAVQYQLIHEAAGHFYQGLDVMMPKIFFHASELRQDAPEDTGDGVSGSFTRKTKPERRFTFTQPLFSGFKEIAAIFGGRAEKKQRRFEYERAQELLFIDVAESFYAVLAARDDARTLEATAGLLDERERDLEARIRIGRSRATELETSTAEAKIVAADLLEARRLERVSLELLEFYVGAPVAGELVDDVSAKGEAADVNYYLNNAPKRLDVMATEQAYELAKHGVTSAFAGFLPTAELEGNYYTERVGLQGGIDWDYTLTLDVPLFDGTQAIGDTRVAAAAREAARQNLSKARRTAELEIRTAHENYTSARAREAAYADARDALKRSYEIQQEDYRLNLVNNLDVLDALRRFEEADRQYHAALYEARVNYWKLKIAAGQRP
ncbi:MAG: hypothetical protein A3D28_03110 [Omnitrophica bacterium RIFCSPHIGHO2_02_FULL_63_14]|nr:MAG: hypothetical protein A3D28_03110 [Omnitrophica bacterium RIFCSPHIGHO2_02_FULL_63_14]